MEILLSIKKNNELSLEEIKSRAKDIKNDLMKGYYYNNNNNNNYYYCVGQDIVQVEFSLNLIDESENIEDNNAILEKIRYINVL